MKILLDTNVVLHIANGSLSKNAKKYIEDSSNIIYFSPVNIWEIIIKNSKMKSEEDYIANPHLLYNNLLSAGYEELKITAKHTLMIKSVPDIHKDPFDRMLLAQSLSEGISLITSDDELRKYSGSIIYVTK